MLGRVAELDAPDQLPCTIRLEHFIKRSLGVRVQVVAHEDDIVAMYPLCTFGNNPVAASIDTPLHGFLPFPHVDHLHPDWGDVANGFIPHWQTGENTLIYWYFAVGVIAAAMVPYEVYFYSSGAVEEGWDESQGDLQVNRMNALFGFALGGVFSVALIVVAAEVFHPLQISPEFLGTTALGAQVSFGEVGLLFAFLGMMFAVGGAAIESSFAGAYTFAQFLGWEWGKSKKARKSRRAPGFTSAWVFLFLLAFIIDLTGANPVLITEYAVVLAVVALPLTYLPVLLIARGEPDPVRNRRSSIRRLLCGSRVATAPSIDRSTEGGK